MKKVLSLSLPMLASMVGGGFVAVAGHIQSGGRPTPEYCSPCGCPKFPECVCDPGEQPGPCDEPAMIASATPVSDSHGAAALLLLLGAGFVVRLRSSR